MLRSNIGHTIQYYTVPDPYLDIQGIIEKILIDSVNNHIFSSHFSATLKFMAASSSFMPLGSVLILNRCIGATSQCSSACTCILQSWTWSSLHV